MGLPQLIGQAGRWLIGSESVPPDERPLTTYNDLIANAKALNRVSEMFIESIDEKLGVEHPHDWSKYAKSYGGYGWLYACVSTIAQSIAGVPLRVYQRRGEEVKEAPGSPLDIVLNQVNPESDWPRFAYLLSVDLELSGNFFMHKLLTPSKKPHLMQLWRLRPERVKVRPEKGAPGGIGGYIYTVNSKEEKFEANEIVHTMFPNPNDDWYGLGALPPATDAADVDSYAIESNRQLLKRGANPRGYLKFDSETGLTEEQARATAEEFDKRYAGPKAHRTAVLRGASYEPIQWKPRDLEYLEMRKMNRQEVCAVFKVPLAILGVEEHSKYTLHEYRKIFWEDCLVPKLRIIEGALNEFLVPDFGRQFFVEFDLSQVPALQRNVQEEARLWLDIVGARVALPNEMRAAMPELFDGPLPAGVGNVMWGSFNEIPLVTVPEATEGKALQPRVVASTQKALPSVGEEGKKKALSRWSRFSQSQLKT